MTKAIEHHRAGRFAEAGRAYASFIERHPHDAAAWSNFGDVLRRLGRLGEALNACQRAVVLAPTLAAGHHNLALALLAVGNELRRTNRIDESIAAYREALKHSQNLSDAWNNLGSALQLQDKLADAAEAFERAIQLQPTLVHAYSNLGSVRRAQGRMDDAMAAHRRALEVMPDSPEALNNFGSALQVDARMAEAEEMFRRAIGLRPDFALAHANLGAMLLMRGDYEAGWLEHEWRIADGREAKFSPAPRWAGEPIDGKTIVLHSEQGFGDTIQFVRYVNLIAPRAGSVVIACQPPLKRLIARMPGVSQVCTTGEWLPSFHCHLSLMSAPFVLGTRVEAIPADVPYLRVDDAKAQAWRSRVGALGAGLKVGLTWTGNPKPDPGRTIPGEMLAPLERCTNARFVSLQKDARRNPPPASLNVADWSKELADFDDTAALASVLDVVISIETVMAHLGGALGRPTWTLLPKMAGWRWFADREDCPWYPTMRLFRQPTAGDWSSVVERITQELEAMSHE